MSQNVTGSYGIFMKSLLQKGILYWLFCISKSPNQELVKFLSPRHDPTNLQCLFLVVQLLPEESLFGEHGTPRGNKHVLYSLLNMLF